LVHNQVERYFSLMTSDVIIIGAGVQGCAVALRLAQAGRQVVVLERAVPGAEASSAAAGILSPGVEAEESGPFYELCAASLALYRDFAAELERLSGIEVGYRPGGTLQVAFDDLSVQAFVARAARLEARGTSVEALDPGQVRQLEPAINPRVRGGLFLRDEASIDPKLLSRALYLAAHKAGASFLTGQVVRIVHQGNRAVGVDHERGRMEAGAVVLAAGSWSFGVEGNGLPPRAVRPVRGQIALLDTRPPLLQRVVFSQKGYVVPRADGRVLCGSTMEEVGHERAITAGGVRSVLDLAIEIAPALIDAPLIDAWCNFRPASPDGWPILGASTVEDLYYATGHTRNGILLCPISADAVSAAILGRSSPVDLAPFSVRRLVTSHC